MYDERTYEYIKEAGNMYFRYSDMMGTNDNTRDTV